MSAVAKLPPLQTGDHLSVREFERRYAAMPDVKTAELIEGVVYMPSPVADDDHGVPHFDFVGWLFVYRVFTPGVQGGDNSTLRLQLGLNMSQPDAYLRLLPEYGGKARVGSDGFVLGAPDLIGEIAASSASYDLHEKLHAYERNAVREYIVWRTQDHAVDWFALRSGRFKRLAANKDGLLKSRVFPGLWLNAAALVEGDVLQVYQTVQAGIASEQHQKFVAKLRST
jgi:Uma2 family endonuclease